MPINSDFPTIQSILLALYRNNLILEQCLSVGRQELIISVVGLAVFT